MSQQIAGFPFEQELQEAGFTPHEMRNQRLRNAAYRLLVRGKLYRFSDVDEIEYGVSGPFNDDECDSQSASVVRALTADAAPSAIAPESCEWKRDDNYEYSTWESSCDEAWIFNDGGPEENGVKYCHGCGKPVKLARIVVQSASGGTK